MEFGKNEKTKITDMKKQNKPTIKLVNPNDPSDYEIVPVEVKLNLKKIMFIARDFPEANHVATLQIGDNGMAMDMIQQYKMVYVAYRMANMNDYVSFEQFQDLYEFDMTEANDIYFSILNREYRTAYLEKIQKACEKVEKTVKTDNSKL